jgi:hypothetical protein
MSKAHHGGAELAQRHPEVPRLTAKQREALRYFNAIAKVRKHAPAGDALITYNVDAMSMMPIAQQAAAACLQTSSQHMNEVMARW